MHLTKDWHPGYIENSYNSVIKTNSKKNGQKIATDTLPPPQNTRMANKPLKRRLQSLVVRETPSKANEVPVHTPRKG